MRRNLEDETDVDFSVVDEGLILKLLWNMKDAGLLSSRFIKSSLTMTNTSRKLTSNNCLDVNLFGAVEWTVSSVKERNIFTLVNKLILNKHFIQNIVNNIVRRKFNILILISNHRNHCEITIILIEITNRMIKELSFCLKLKYLNPQIFATFDI